MPFSEIQDAIRDHFFTSKPLLSRAVAFANAGVGREGWFNGELVYLFREMKERGTIKTSVSEYPSNIGYKTCDFKIELPMDIPAVIEIKAFAARSPSHSRVSDWTLRN